MYIPMVWFCTFGVYPLLPNETCWFLAVDPYAD